MTKPDSEVGSGDALTPTSSEAPGAEDSDAQALRSVRRQAGLALVLLIVAGVAAVVLDPTVSIPFLAAVLVPGIIVSVGVFRHPERLKRVDTARLRDSIVAGGGLDLTRLQRASSAELRLAVVDALDATRGTGASRRTVLWGKVAASVGAVAWGLGGVAAWVYAQDVAGVVICTGMAGFFGALRFYIGRQARLARQAVALLEEQLAAIERQADTELGVRELPGQAG